MENMGDRLRSIIEEIEDWKHLNFATVELDTDMPEEERGQSFETVDEEGEEGGDENRDGMADGREDEDDNAGGL